MAELLITIEDPTFSWYPKWMELFAQQKLIKASVLRSTASSRLTCSNPRSFLIAAMMLLFIMASVKVLSRAKRRPNKTQKPRKKSVTRTKTIFLDDIIVMIPNNTSPMIKIIIWTIVMIPHATNAGQ